MAGPVIVFDLDDTLYLERDFAWSGFAAAGALLARTRGVPDFAARARRRFEAGERGRIFDAVLDELGIDPGGGLLDALVRRYRRHRPRIVLAPDAAAWLARPRAGRRALLTDGHPVTQRNKIVALGLDRAGLAPCIRTGCWGAGYGKPHERGFAAIEAACLGATGFAYVADNCAKDFIAPRRRGWRTIQIVRPGGVHQEPPAHAAAAPDARIASLDALDTTLAELGSGPGGRG